MRALVNPLIGRERDDENVAVALGFLEVTQVADVQEVEDAVAVDDLLPLLAETGQDGRKVVEILDLPEGGRLRTTGGWDHVATSLWRCRAPLSGRGYTGDGFGLYPI